MAHSLVSLKGTHLRFVYVILHNLNFWDLVSSKTKDLVTKEQSAHFYDWLKREADKLNVVEDQELQLDLLLELSKTLKLSMRLLDDPYKVVKQCDEIVEEAFQQLQKQYKDFSSVFEQFANKNKVEFLVHWEMTQLYVHMNAQQSKNDKEAPTVIWVEEILKFVEHMPSYQQEQVKDRIHVAEWTAEELQLLLIQDPFSVFTAIVEKTGFGFYKYLLQCFATKRPAAVLEPQEAAYFSWMMNPDLLLSLIFKGDGILYRYQNLLFNKGLLPMVLLETILPYLADKETEEEEDEELAVVTYSWNKRFAEYRKMLRSVNEMVQKQNDWKKGLDILREELKEAEAVFRQTETYNLQLHEQLTQLLKQDPARPYFGELSVKNNRLQEDLKKIESKLAKQENIKKGIIGSVTTFIKSSYHQTTKAQVEKKIDKLFDEMTALVLDKYHDYEPNLIQEIHRSNAELSELNLNKQEIQRKIEKFTEKLAEVRKQEKQMRSAIAEAEKRTHGLAQLYKSEMEKERTSYVNEL
ncbi:hypothetical protein AC623_06795 [Bacillus sp. FJAT-27231]|uniref:hypothetical protein n=1 Tax=Bacillus sp. FJAT-27231 TaxID=1679168 RepID=UPI000671705E|nr:hypothetical protein [Bacillus sp. FJAT-27231]KMY53738.1 hypothetical protein AC623_06795 [Bacillus sp. FJAT-27231]